MKQQAILTLIQDALNVIAKNKTVIIVAHRISPLRLCERIINLDDINNRPTTEVFNYVDVTS